MVLLQFTTDTTTVHDWDYYSSLLMLLQFTTDAGTVHCWYYYRAPSAASSGNNGGVVHDAVLRVLGFTLVHRDIYEVIAAAAAAAVNTAVASASRHLH